MLDLFTELDAMQQTVTPEEIARSARSLDKVKQGETSLGKITNDTAIRYYALSGRFRAEEDAALHVAAYKANSQEEEDEAVRKAARLHALLMLAMGACYFQIKDDLDRNGSAWNSSGVAIRRDWTLVAAPKGKHVNPIRHIMGGILPPGMFNNEEDGD